MEVCAYLSVCLYVKWKQLIYIYLMFFIHGCIMGAKVPMRTSLTASLFSLLSGKVFLPSLPPPPTLFCLHFRSLVIISPPLYCILSAPSLISFSSHPIVLSLHFPPRLFCLPFRSHGQRCYSLYGNIVVLGWGKINRSEPDVPVLLGFSAGDKEAETILCGSLQWSHLSKHRKIKDALDRDGEIIYLKEERQRKSCLTMTDVSPGI